MSVSGSGTRRGLVTAQTGRPFTRQSITTILRNPRLAGLAVLPRREASGTANQDGRAGRRSWPRRPGGRSRRCWPTRPQAAAGVRTLLGGLAACACGNVVDGSMNHRRDHVYRCQYSTRGGRPGPHVAVRAEPVDGGWRGPCWRRWPARAGGPGDPAAARGHGGAARPGRRDPRQPRRDGRRPGGRAHQPQPDARRARSGETPGWPRSPPSWPRRPGKGRWPRSPAGRPPRPCGTAWTYRAGVR